MSIVTDSFARAREDRLENIRRFGEYYTACPFCRNRKVARTHCIRCYSTGRMAQGSVDKLERDGEL